MPHHHLIVTWHDAAGRRDLLIVTIYRPHHRLWISVEAGYSSMSTWLMLRLRVDRNTQVRHSTFKARRAWACCSHAYGMHCSPNHAPAHDDLVGLRFHPRGAEGRQVQTRVVIEHELVLDDLRRHLGRQRAGGEAVRLAEHARVVDEARGKGGVDGILQRKAGLDQRVDADQLRSFEARRWCDDARSARLRHGTAETWQLPPRT